MTTDITELAQSLKAAAEKASGSVWTSDGCGGVCSESGTNNGFYVAECDGSDWEENSRFIVLANPANILALVEALEKAQQTEKTLESRNRRLDGIITAAEKRIAERESRTVKLPAERFCPAEYAGSQLWSEVEAWNKAISACSKALAEAGIHDESENEK
ncbi:ead/Ea22-like family protein [Klebsiella quasivariicola]|uniref:ead/Ea22-like family protein n=1 Tax=Klebsiella quasivariicola TaxID=2026240 RepID=UPI002479CCB8|nr:ead/Ea22-like family protein [Klebsiella quasivariicola]